MCEANREGKEYELQVNYILLQLFQNRRQIAWNTLPVKQISLQEFKIKNSTRWILSKIMLLSANLVQYIIRSKKSGLTKVCCVGWVQNILLSYYEEGFYYPKRKELVQFRYIKKPMRIQCSQRINIFSYKLPWNWRLTWIR